MGPLKRNVLVVALALVALAGLGAAAYLARVASNPSTPEPDLSVAVARFAAAQSQDRRTVRIGGFVRSEDGAPIENALACDHPSFDAPSQCAATARDGSFSIAVPSGFHKLEVASPPGSSFVSAWYDGADRSRDATLLDLRASDRLDLRVALSRGRGVSGLVVARDGRPVADAQVCADPYDRLGEWTCVRTDREGAYSAIVPDGEYLLFFVPPEGTRLIPRWWRSGDDIYAADVLDVRGRDAAAIDATLVEGNLIFGTVRATSGKPLEHVLVCVDTRFPTGRICRPTDKSGAYRIAVRRGTFLVQFRASPTAGVVSEWYGSTFDPRAAREVVVNADVRIDASLRTGKLLWGTVRTRDGLPLDGATVNVYEASSACCVPVAAAVASAAGDYATIVPAGRYWVEAFPPFGSAYVSGFHGGAAFETARIVEVREKDTDVFAEVALDPFKEP